MLRAAGGRSATAPAAARVVIGRDQFVEVLGELVDLSTAIAGGRGSAAAAEDIRVALGAASPAGEVEARDIELLTEIAVSLRNAATAQRVGGDERSVALCMAQSAVSSGRLNERWRGRE